ncbi:MAG TPA: hypothetical protein VE985_02530 [Gaiellaceae bacterium]|nr:hypothetical protein [Gaiellaceae bacterium]
MRLDEEKLEALQSWGEKLGESEREESSAVGRAILMLVEEIDRLHIELWHARIESGSGHPVSADRTTEGVHGSVQSRLHGRLREALRGHPATEAAEHGSDAEREKPTSKSWIARSRRQK